MTVKNTPIQYPVGIEDLYIVMMADGKDSKVELPTYDEDVYSMTNIVDVGIAGNSSNFTKWASNQMIINVTKNSQYTLTFNLAGLPQELKDKIFGVLREKGVAFDDSEVKEMPYFALGLICPLNDGTKIARWYPRCQITPTDESMATLTAEMDIPDQQYVITASPLIYNKVTKTDFNSGDATAKDITVEDYMKNVICDKTQLENLGGTTPPASRKGDK